MVPVGVVELRPGARRARPAGGPAGSCWRTTALPGSAPYSSSVAGDSCEMSISSGTLRLHAERHLVLADARGDLRVADVGELRLVQLLRRRRARGGGRRPVWPLRVGEEQHRVAAGAELDALVDARQEAGRPQAGARAAERAGEQHDVGRQVLVLRAEAVGRPTSRSSAGRRGRSRCAGTSAPGRG